MTDLQIIGGGQMGQALAGGLLSSGWADNKSLAIIEVSSDQQTFLTARYPTIQVLGEPLPGVDTLVAVKPHFVETVCRSLDAPTRVMSIAAGITIRAIEACVPQGTPVVRAMPNTPALIGKGAAGFAGGTSATDAELSWAKGILEAVGQAAEVTEPQLDAVTGLSGSGPAYVFMIAEALVDGAVAAGLPRDTAKLLAHQTLLGAAAMLVESDTPASELRAAVTTPAGTTAAGLRELEDGGLRSAIINAVNAATERATELGLASNS